MCACAEAWTHDPQIKSTAKRKRPLVKNSPINLEISKFYCILIVTSFKSLCNIEALSPCQVFDSLNPFYVENKNGKVRIHSG